MSSTDSSEQELRDAQVAKLRLEIVKLEREIAQLDRPFWHRPSFWRSMLAAVAIGAAVSAGMGRYG